MRQYNATIFVYDDEENEIELEVTGWYMPAEGDGWNTPRYGDSWEDIQLFRDGVELTNDEVNDWYLELAEEALQKVLTDERLQMLEDKAEARYNARQDADEFYSSDKFNGGW